MLGGFQKVAFLFCDHPRGTPQDKFFAEDALFYRISERVQVLKTVTGNKGLCTIPDPLQDKRSTCLGRRKRVAVQSVKVPIKKPKYQSVERVQAPAGGRQVLPGGATGWDMIVGFSHYAVVFRNNSQSFLRLVRFAPQSVSKPDHR